MNKKDYEYFIVTLYYWKAFNLTFEEAKQKAFENL